MIAKGADLKQIATELLGKPTMQNADNSRTTVRGKKIANILQLIIYTFNRQVL